MKNVFKELAEFIGAENIVITTGSVIRFDFFEMRFRIMVFGYDDLIVERMLNGILYIDDYSKKVEKLLRIAKGNLYPEHLI